jgi:hypothetical protein
MAAQGGIRDKNLRVSVPFEKRADSGRYSTIVRTQKNIVVGNATDPWPVVLKVRSWTAQLREGRVYSCAAIARREGITPAPVSQRRSRYEITREKADEDLSASEGRDVSIRRLIRIFRNPGIKPKAPRMENIAAG